MDREKLRKRVRTLREKGKTYAEIQKTLMVKIPKSTLSYWCKGVPLPDFYKEKIDLLNYSHLERIRAFAIMAKKRKREIFLKSLQEKNNYLVKYINKDVCRLLLSVLYLAEGGKYERGCSLCLGSSDSKMVRFYLALLHKCFTVSEDKLRARICCRHDQNIKEIEGFWQFVTEIPPSQFYRTYVDKRTIGKKTKRKEYKGVCSVYYFDTKIHLEIEQLYSQIMGWVEYK